MKTRLKNICWLASGITCIALAIIGALLPVMPTTVFIIMAAACFSRGHPGLHRWLIRHPRFGPPLKTWQEHRGMSAKSKKTALITIALSFSLSLYMVQHQSWLVVLLLFIWLCLSLWMLKLPTISANTETGTRIKEHAQPMRLDGET